MKSHLPIFFNKYPPKNYDAPILAANIPFFKAYHSFFENAFFLNTSIELSKLAPDLKNPENYNTLKKYFKFYKSFSK